MDGSSFRVEQIAGGRLSPEVMALALQVFPRRFAFLLPELLLLRLDPAELGDREHPDGIQFHPQRCGDAYPAGGRVDAEVDVLDVFENDVHGDVAELDLGAHQSWGCCLTMRKIRSTSALSWRISYKACWITRSRA